MTSELIVLEGCAPVPLAGYLKALGVFRLVAEQKDPDARGFWRDERFVLKTRLSREELVGFFLNEFHPTPVISPWNGGSGFYFQEGKTKEKDPATGKRIKTGVRDQATEATRVLDNILSSKTERLRAYREAIESAKVRLTVRNFNAAPGDDDKAKLIRELRSEAPDATAAWIDASSTVTQRDVVFPPLLGSGGNDGNLDFSTTIIQAIISLIDLQSGAPSAEANSLLTASLFAEVTQTGGGTAISQFAPSAIGAPNSSVGFGGASSGIAWDVIFGFEGTLVMSTALARRIGAEGDGAASFPFMIARRGVFGAGAGNVAPADENARGEFWAPLWRRPATLGELTTLFREGRAVVDRKIANDALDFAQALGRLGVDRGVEQFERYAFEQRYGNMHLGVPLGRWRVERNANADLVAEITASGWLDRARAAVRGKGAPASMLALGRRLDDALFRLAGDKSSDAVQEALMAIGALVVETGRRPKLRESLPPPPRLSSDWSKTADDGSHEFALAAALASLDASTVDDGFRLPFRRHLAPLSVSKAREAWDDTTEAHALAVWTGRDLIRDMGRVHERRLIEAQRREFLRNGKPEFPLRGWKRAPLAAVASFIANRRTDDHIGALAAGLAWAGQFSRTATEMATDETMTSDAWRNAKAASTKERSDDEAPWPPLVYAALKPLFDPKGVAAPRPPGKATRQYGKDDTRARKIVNPLPLLRLLQAGRPIDEVVIAAYRIARGAGLTVPFPADKLTSAAVPARLAAALILPIRDSDMERLAWRAYPDSKQDEENSDAA
ncbi:MAG: type I-U CRISPR-associated protein Csx17 [Hyphomonadaceae bacterium]|nr:type I-U CRISPR-associated protein Csx17 [Hyphomonadaceae bacterium]